MSKTYTPAQKRAYAIKMQKQRDSEYVSGRGSYKKNPRSTVRRNVVRGKGDYKKDYGQRLGSVVGEGLQELLTQLGGLGGMGMKAMTGVGDYAPAGFKVRSNKLAEGNDPPEVINGSDGSFVMRHREFITDIITPATAPVAFTNQIFNINPGVAGTFPWLASIAKNFEQYKVEGLIFEFKSTYSEGTTGSLGSVIMATEYDVTRDSFESKQVMENHQFASSCKTSKSMLHPVECARSQTPINELYVRTAPCGTDEDARLCDLGKFQIALQGQSQANTTIGELWCSYQIRFLKPKMANSGDIVASDYFQNATGIATATPLGTLANMTKGRGNSLGLTVSAAGQVSFPSNIESGTYLVSILWAWTVLTATTQPALGTFVNCGVNVFNDPFTASYQSPLVGETATRKSRTWAVTVTGDGASFIIGSGALPASTNLVQLVVSQMDIDLGTQVPYSVSALIEESMEKQRYKFIEQEDLFPTPKDEDEGETPDLNQTSLTDKDKILLSGKYTLEDLQRLISITK